MRLAILFSGQGNQLPAHLERLRESVAPELGAALSRAIPSVWAVSELPAGELQANRVAQPLIFALQMNLWRQLQPHLPRPVCVAGYSLGEMAACCAAGAFPAEAGLGLCATRAGLMDACVEGPAGLLAVIGPRAPEMEALARQISTPLDWDACLGAVLEMQPDAVLEIGPGNALARMWGERESAVPVRASDDFRTVAGIIEWVRARA